MLDADAMAREAVAVGAPAWVELRRLYGEEYFHENGELNRSRLAQLVFADPEARRRLDGLIHPRVEAELQARVAELAPPGRAVGAGGGAAVVRNRPGGGL